MTAFIGPTNESGIKYTLTGPSGFIAVFNDPTDPNYVGGLTADDAVTGLDSGEIIESFTQKTEDDGAQHGNFFFGRRPITFSGNIVPTSALDRATRLDKFLKCVKSCMRSDGVLSFTPTGGEPVFLSVRAQQPPRVKGKWVKEFFLSLVAADPRAYSLKRSTAYLTPTSTGNATHDRFTYASGSNTPLATRTVYLPPGTWKIRIPIKRSTASGTLAVSASNSTGASTPASLTTAWTELSQTVVTANAETVATTITLTLSAALSAAQWVEVGPIVFESAAGLYPSGANTLGTNWSASTGYTRSAVTAGTPAGSERLIENQGDSQAFPRLRVLGPATAAYVLPGTSGAQVWFNPVAFVAADWLAIETGAKTMLENNTTNVYSYNVPASTVWGGMPVGYTTPIFSPYGGSGATNVLEVMWRNTYL